MGPGQEEPQEEASAAHMGASPGRDELGDSGHGSPLAPQPLLGNDQSEVCSIRSRDVLGDLRTLGTESKEGFSPKESFISLT